MDGHLTRTTYFTSDFENTWKENIFLLELVLIFIRDLRQGFP